MEALQRREAAIFALLQQIAKYEWVLIGGYAVNAYTLPRFSVDCDIVVRGETALRPIIAVLERNGFKEQNTEREALPYGGKFLRYERDIGERMRVSMDIIVGNIFDRQSGVVFAADWVFANSAMRLSMRTSSEFPDMPTFVRVVNPHTPSCFALRSISFAAPMAKTVSPHFAQTSAGKFPSATPRCV